LPAAVDQISSTDTVITHTHTYDGFEEYGLRTISVRGFNLANNDTRSAEVSVCEWLCYPPVVAVNQSSPLVVENKDGFLVSATFVEDCMKNERFASVWELVDSNNAVLRTLTDATEMTSDPYELAMGIYEVRITASYWSHYFDLTDMTVVVNTTVNVSWSELVAGIEGSHSINASADETIQLSAYNLTYDLSVQSASDKSGMILQWRCKRSNETWPSQPPSQSYVPHSGTSSNLTCPSGTSSTVPVPVLRAPQRYQRWMFRRRRSRYTGLCGGTVGVDV